mgnify:CR=1 FL=1
MNMKNVKAQSAKALANVSLKLGKVSVDSACCYIFHQPKVPKDLKKLKKIRNETAVRKINRICY